MGLSLVGTIHGGPYHRVTWIMIPIVVLCFGALQGMFVEWIGVRPAIKIKSEFGWIMSTIALAIIFKNVAENIWGKDDVAVPVAIAGHALQQVFGANVQPMQVAVIVGALAHHGWPWSCSTASRFTARPSSPPPTTAMRPG